MTCATCHGMKVVRRVEVDRTASVPTFISNTAPRSRTRQVEAPCPDCTSRPFARRIDTVEVAGDLYGLIEIGHGANEVRVLVDARGASDLSAVQCLNEEVETFEAKLRGALFDAMTPPCSLHGAGPRDTFHVPGCDWCQKYVDARGRARAALEGGGEYVSGDVACGLAFDAGALQAKLEGSWGVLLDALADRDAIDERSLSALAQTLGVFIKKPFVPLWQRMESLSNEQLAAEVRRRKAVGALEHIFAEHEYGHDGTSVTITGRSFCGLELKRDGNWSAVTPEHASALGQPDLHCQACIRAQRTAAAMVDMVQPA